MGKVFSTSPQLLFVLLLAIGYLYSPCQAAPRIDVDPAEETEGPPSKFFVRFFDSSNTLIKEINAGKTLLSSNGRFVVIYDGEGSKSKIEIFNLAGNKIGEISKYTDIRDVSDKGAVVGYGSGELIFYSSNGAELKRTTTKSPTELSVYTGKYFMGEDIFLFLSQQCKKNPNTDCDVTATGFDYKGNQLWQKRIARTYISGIPDEALQVYEQNPKLLAILLRREGSGDYLQIRYDINGKLVKRKDLNRK